jgi:hypothetical protein
MHLFSNCHLSFEDTLFGKPLPIPQFLEMPSHFLKNYTIMYISLA